MKTNEEKKIVRVFQIIVIWTLFAAFTVYGLVSAAERTAFIDAGKEAETIVFNAQLTMHNAQLFFRM